MSTPSKLELLALPLAASLHGEETRTLFSRVAADFQARTGIGLREGEEGEVLSEPLPVFLLLTGGTEAELLALARKAAGPLLVLSHGTHNSLPAALEAVARLRSDGRQVRLVHLDTGRAARELVLLSRATALAKALRGLRVGLIGGASPWLVASSPDQGVLEGKLGIEVIQFSLREVLRRLPEVAPPVGAPGEGVEEEGRRMGPRVYIALRELIKEHRLSGISIACFGLLKYGLTACWALSRLSDEGIAGGCEGDLPALLALLCAHALTGVPGFLANPADVDPKRERLVLAHCTVPLKLVEDFRLRTHFESGMGLAIAGALRPGPYTLVRFGGARLERAFIVEGTVLPERPGREDLCRTQVVFKSPKGALEKLLSEPLGNHHVLIPGHQRAVLAAFHELFLARI
ncbi:TPA: hypothetical protein EYH33_01505 [Candidatus Bipolaricaulota bacterium]|nr:hypothetical protein [Candidatus Bipolaricaulota bacterium]